MYALSKLNKQNKQPWVNLQKRLNEVQLSYKNLFPNSDIQNFIRKAVSVGSCEGYFKPSLLTTTGFLLASKGACVQMSAHNRPLYIFTTFAGYPETGKCIVPSLKKILWNYSIHSHISSKFLYMVQFLIPLFSINLLRKIVHNSACCPKPVRTLRFHHFHYQQNKVLRTGETAGKST